MISANNRKIGLYEIGILVIVISVIILLISQFILPLFFTSEKGDVRIGVIDAGCNESQSSFVEEYKTFVLTQYGYSESETAIYSGRSHGEIVCSLIHQVSPSSGLYSARIESSRREITFEGILGAIDWLVSDVHVDIINLSLGSLPYLDGSIKEIFVEFQDDVIFVAAAGNHGFGDTVTPGYGDWPAIIPNVIGVGSVLGTNPVERDGISSFGLTYEGLYVAEFVEDGKVNNLSGTSFSAPRITGYLANIIQKFKQSGFAYVISDVIHIAIKNTNLEFSPEIGWGIPTTEIDLFSNLSSSILIEGYNQLDPINRFQNETWELSYKILHYKYSEETFNELTFEFYGNGSSSIVSTELEYYTWGAILKLHLKNQFNSSLQTILIETDESNIVSYSYFSKTVPNGKILFDTRHAINGLSNPYAQYSELDDALRKSGYETNYVYNDEIINLEDYDIILLPNYGQQEMIVLKTLERLGIENRNDEYLAYVQNGGNIGILLNRPGKTNLVDTSSLLDEFNTTISEFSIGSQANLYESCCAEIIANFSTNPDLEGVSRINFVGMELETINQNNEMGWYEHRIINQVVNTIIYRSIGVSGSYGFGRFFIIGGSSMLSNEFFGPSTESSIVNLLTNQFTRF